MNTHPGMEPNFTSKPMHSGVKFNLDRFITKGHEINKCSLDNQIKLINRQSGATEGSQGGKSTTSDYKYT